MGGRECLATCVSQSRRVWGIFVCGNGAGLVVIFFCFFFVGKVKESQRGRQGKVRGKEKDDDRGRRRRKEER